MNVYLRAFILLIGVFTEIVFIFYVTGTPPLDSIPAIAGFALWILALVVVPFVLPEVYRALKREDGQGV